MNVALLVAVFVVAEFLLAIAVGRFLRSDAGAFDRGLLQTAECDDSSAAAGCDRAYPAVASRSRAA